MPAFASMTVAMNSRLSVVIVIPAQVGIQQVCSAAFWILRKIQIDPLRAHL